MRVLTNICDVCLARKVVTPAVGKYVGKNGMRKDVCEYHVTKDIEKVMVRYEVEGDVLRRTLERIEHGN